MPPAKFELPDNSIGKNEEDDLESIQRPNLLQPDLDNNPELDYEIDDGLDEELSEPVLSEAYSGFTNFEVQKAIANDKRHKANLEEQREILYSLLSAGPGNSYIIQAPTFKEAQRLRFRFYRCKDQLRNAGNNIFSSFACIIKKVQKGYELRVLYPKPLRGVIRPISEDEE